VQLDPGYPVVFAVDPALAFRDFQRLKLKHDKLLSNFACFAFNCNLRHYTAVRAEVIASNAAAGPLRTTPSLFSLT